MPYLDDDEDQLPIVGSPSREELARLMFIYGMPGHLATSLGAMSMPDDETGGEDDEGQSVMTYGGDTSGNDSAAQAWEEQGYMGAGGSSSPLNVTPLSERTSGIMGQPPSRQQKIAGLISDMIVGGIAGGSRQLRRATALHGGNESPVFAGLQGGLMGARAAEMNRREREDRARVYALQDFGIQEKLYNADIQRAKFEAQESRLNAQAQATKAYHEALAEQAKARGRAMIEQMKYGEVKIVGNDVWRLYKDGRPPQKISETPDGEFARKVKFLAEQAKAQGWTQEEYRNRVNHLVDPTFESPEQKAAKKAEKEDTTAFRTARSKEATQSYTDGLYDLFGGDLKLMKAKIADDARTKTLPEFVSSTGAHGIVAAIEQRENVLSPPPKPPPTPTIRDKRQEDLDLQDKFESDIADDLFRKYKSGPLAVKRLVTEDLSSYVTRHKRTPRLANVAEYLKKLILSKAQSKGSGDANRFDQLSGGGGGGTAAPTGATSTPSGPGTMPQPRPGYEYEFDLATGKVIEVPIKK